MSKISPSRVKSVTCVVGGEILQYIVGVRSHTLTQIVSKLIKDKILIGVNSQREVEKSSEKRIEMRILIASALIGMLVAWKLVIIGGNEVINFFAEHLQGSEKANSEANAEIMDVVYVICCQPTQYMTLVKLQ